jgi:uncharacterized protein YndB with AHSA1/START domain
MTEPSIIETRDIEAPAARIFSIVSDPAHHPAIDGTGMLRSADDNQIMSRVGDVFFMSMTHWDLGDYVMENHVVEFEQDRRIAWEPVAQVNKDARWDRMPSNREPREWGWRLEPLSEERTRVTAFFEGSRLSDGLRKFVEDGEFWRPAMVTSLENLERLATTPDGTGEASPRSETAAKFAAFYEGE